MPLGALEGFRLAKPDASEPTAQNHSPFKVEPEQSIAAGRERQPPFKQPAAGVVGVHQLDVSPAFAPRFGGEPRRPDRTRRAGAQLRQVGFPAVVRKRGGPRVARLDRPINPRAREAGSACSEPGPRPRADGRRCGWRPALPGRSPLPTGSSRPLAESIRPSPRERRWPRSGPDAPPHSRAIGPRWPRHPSGPPPTGPPGPATGQSRPTAGPAGPHRAEASSATLPTRSNTPPPTPPIVATSDSALRSGRNLRTQKNLGGL